jgi:hypothetical protein
MDEVWQFNARASGDGVIALVPRGPHVRIEIEYDANLSEVRYAYDNDIGDEIPEIEFGPFPYRGRTEDSHLVYMIASSTSLTRVDGILDLWSTTPFSDLAGDFNGNEALDAGDMDLLSAEVRSGSNLSSFDLNGDTVVDDLDRQVWVHDLKQTYFGDSDLNGSFDSTDLVQVLSFGQYEDDSTGNSTWQTGDWDGDGDFVSSDLVTALADGGYEAGPRAAVVPEPSSLLLLSVTFFAVLSRRLAS